MKITGTPPMMSDIYAWAAGNSAALLAFGLWLLRLQKQANDAEVLAKSVKEKAVEIEETNRNAAAEIKQAIAEIHNSLTALTANFSLFRETAARELVSQGTVKELEDRLGQLTNMKYDHLVQQNNDLRADVQQLNNRFDAFIATLVSQQTPAPTPRRRRTAA